MTKYLSQQQVFQLTDAAIDLGLGFSRPQLLGAIDKRYAAMLPTASSPRLQLVSDLQRLAERSPLEDGSVPLLQWLEVARGLAGGLPEAHLFDELYEHVAQQEDQRTAVPRASSLPESTEAVFNVDDRLGLGFFEGALRTARSIAKLTVPVFSGGQAQLSDGGDPLRSHGTSWVIGSGGLLITNAHVIRARNSKTAIVGDGDLALQREHARAYFDFEDGKQSIEVAIAELLTFDVDLDYALLQLADPHPNRDPLPLQLQPIDLSIGTGGPDGRAYKPVNIIQHPGGEPKRAAFRNNLVTRSEPTALRYFTDTEHGSSGAPVCNDRWQVVALHRSSGRLDKVVNFQGRSEASANIGTPIGAIVGHLSSHRPTLWDALRDRFAVV